jgi:predicted esterase
MRLPCPRRRLRCHRRLGDRRGVLIEEYDGFFLAGIRCYQVRALAPVSSPSQILADLRDRLTPADGKVVLMGFSQGAQMAAVIAAQSPARYVAPS